MAASRKPEQLHTSLRRSVNAARGLSFALAGVSGQLGGSVNLAAQLAENIAKVSKNARIAGSANAIGAVVALLGTAVSFAVGWSAKTKEVARAVAEVRRETEVLNARGAGDDRRAAELEIANAMERELIAAKGLESRLRKFPQLHEAIRNKADAARRALTAERDRDFADQLSELGRARVVPGSGTDAEVARQQSIKDAEHDRDSQLRALARNSRFEPTQKAAIERAILDQFEADLRDIQHASEAPVRALGDQLGVTLADSIADGLAKGLASGRIGDGFKALTGGILIGLGNMMIQVGTQSLLAARLMDGIVKALRAFAPEAAIGRSLLLIAAGGVVRSLGQSLSASGGGGGSAPSYGSASGRSTSYVGIVNPLPTVATVNPVQPVTVNATIIGLDDPKAQRSIMELIERGGRRRG